MYCNWRSQTRSTSSLLKLIVLGVLLISALLVLPFNEEIIPPLGQAQSDLNKSTLGGYSNRLHSCPYPILSSFEERAKRPHLWIFSRFERSNILPSSYFRCLWRYARRGRLHCRNIGGCNCCAYVQPIFITPFLYQIDHAGFSGVPSSSDASEASFFRSFDSKK